MNVDTSCNNHALVLPPLTLVLVKSNGSLVSIDKKKRKIAEEQTV